MDDPLGFLLWAGAATALLVLGVVLLRGLGPADWSLFRRRPDASWPRGVQEEEPRPWDFGARDAPRAAPTQADDVAPPGPGVADAPARRTDVPPSE